MSILRPLLPLTLASLAALTVAPQIGCGGEDSDPFPSSGGSGPGGGSGSGGSGEPTAGDHLLISEVMLVPEAGEMVEIWNPTSREIDLGDYYLSDNSTYSGIATGNPWSPAGSPGSDFLVRFPPGAKIAPDAVLVLSGNPEFESVHGRCADYTFSSLSTPCASTGAAATPMVAPDGGGLGTQSSGVLTNDGEMLILFKWSGVANEIVKDVDYVVWGTALGTSEVVNKTNKEGYLPDTPAAMQRPLTLPTNGQSAERCVLETGEILTGGNGLTGHDETSEPLDQTFVPAAVPSPGQKNACLSN